MCNKYESTLIQELKIKYNGKFKAVVRNSQSAEIGESAVSLSVLATGMTLAFCLEIFTVVGV